MPETFLDRRRATLQTFIDSYGGTKEDVEYYLQMWVQGRIRQVDVEMIMARDFGATTEEIADLYGYRKGEDGSNGAAVAMNEARKKARSVGFKFRD